MKALSFLFSLLTLSPEEAMSNSSFLIACWNGVGAEADEEAEDEAEFGVEFEVEEVEVDFEAEDFEERLDSDFPSFPLSF